MRHTASSMSAVAARAAGQQDGGRDGLYRQRGYGYGGTVFALGSAGGGRALGGTCTELADTNPSCRHGGVYGNGFTYGFGSP